MDIQYVCVIVHSTDELMSQLSKHQWCYIAAHESQCSLVYSQRFTVASGEIMFCHY